ncbi:type IV pilus assembly protein PilM [Patescibacteria group bacterium]|nr:type IV pilus assembly protein PilM [Patescibacteria group bacterium]
MQIERFLTLHPETFGLDLSDYSMKVAQLERSKGEFSLRSFGEFPLPNGAIERGEIKKPEELAARIIESLLKVQGKQISTPYVVASLPEEQAFLQVIQLPRMKLEEVRDAVNFEAENYIPYEIDTVYLDYEVINPLRGPLDHLDILLAALPRDTVDPYLTVLEKAGLVPRALEIESLAVSRAVVKEGISLTPLLIMDMGKTKTRLNVFAGSSLQFTTSLPISGDQMTDAIAKTLEIPEKRAEDLKHHQGKEAKRVFEALIPTLTDLAEQVKKYMDYYASHAAHQHMEGTRMQIQKMLLCGGGASLQGLREFLASQLKVEVELGNPWLNILSFPVRRTPPLSYLDSLPYTTALGLALRAARASSLSSL